MEGTVSDPWKFVEIPTRKWGNLYLVHQKDGFFQEAGAKAIEAAFRRCALYQYLPCRCETYPWCFD